MKRPYLKNNFFLIFVLLISLIHFAASDITQRYIGKQVGTQVGQIVAKSIVRAFDDEKTTNKIYKDMKSESESFKSRWDTACFIISLPTGPAFKPLKKKIIDKYVLKPARSGEITRNQFENRWTMIDKLYMAINSLAFGLFLFCALKIFLRVKGDRT